MKLANTAMIPEIDRYCAEKLHISMLDLIGRSGKAVAKAVRAKTAPGTPVVILAGRGNNGADGYAAAADLLADHPVTVFDVLDAGQNSEEGRAYLQKFTDAGGEVRSLTMSAADMAIIEKSGCIVDAMFGTGFHGQIPDPIREIARKIRVLTHTVKIAVDVPLGVNADDGSVTDDAMYVDTTVELSFIKCGVVSFPARGYVGEIMFDDLGLPRDEISEVFDFKYHLIEKNWVERNLPTRPDNSNKGTFGKVLLITGSHTYRGAAALSMEGALRGGVGMVTYLGEEDLSAELRAKFPETIYKNIPAVTELTKEERAQIVQLSAGHTATLVGCGSGNSPELFALVRDLLASEGGPLILDADAINSLTWDREAGLSALRSAKRPVVLTPHPMEFSRLYNVPVTDVQLHRIEYAKQFAAENGVTLALKGAGTVVTDGDELFINHTGSSALAKAGSGDVLAGFIAALAAQGVKPLYAAVHGVYFHGRAADSLAKEFSSFGVIPSDLPRQIAREMSAFVSESEEL